MTDEVENQHGSNLQLFLTHFTKPVGKKMVNVIIT